MLIVCAIGYGVLIFTIGIYVFFGSWEKAFKKPLSKSTSTSSSDSGHWGSGWIWLDMISFLASLYRNPKHWLCLFLGILAGIGSTYIYAPPFSEILLVSGFAAVLGWRQFRIKNPINKKPEVSAQIPQPINQPSPTQPEPEDSNLNQVYEICTMYLVALDEQFTPEEQEKVDHHFGPGTADRFIQKLPSIIWEEQFAELHDLVSRLSPSDRFQLKTHGRTFFQSILSADDFTASEKTRFDEILRFLDESMGHKPLT